METICVEEQPFPADGHATAPAQSQLQTAAVGNAQRLINSLPPVFRVVSISRLPVNPQRHLARAELFHERTTLTVAWLDHELDDAVAEGALVSIRWMKHTVSFGGAIRVKRLQPHDRPDPTINLFETVPHHWAGNRGQIRAAAERWRRMPHDMRLRFNALFWDGWRFRQYFSDRHVLGECPLAAPTPTQ